MNLPECFLQYIDERKNGQSGKKDIREEAVVTGAVCSTSANDSDSMCSVGLLVDSPSPDSPQTIFGRAPDTLDSPPYPLTVS